MFLYKYVFNRICNIFQCNGIHYAVYDCEWFSLDPKEAKDLILFIIKLSEPIYFTAGKLFPITMVMFGNVVYIYINLNLKHDIKYL